MSTLKDYLKANGRATCGRCPPAPSRRDESSINNPTPGHQRSPHQQMEEDPGTKWSSYLEIRNYSGNTPKLSDVEQQQLIQKLEKGALALGFTTEKWNQARVKEEVEREFRVHYYRDSISRSLNGLDCSVQKKDSSAKIYLVQSPSSAISYFSSE